MTRQEQIDEMAVIGCVRNPQAHTAEECAKCDFKQGQCNAYRHAEALYDVGCRKTPNDIRELIDLLYEGAKLKEKLDEIKQLENENKELKAKLEKRLTCDLVKTAQKQAVQDFVEKLKEECCKVKGYEYSFANIAYLINQLLKEYE